MKKLAVGIVLFALLSVVMMEPAQAATQNSLSLQLISQWTDVSCWAASGTMVIGYYAHLSMSHGFATKVQQALAYYMSGNTYGLSHGIPISTFQVVMGNYASAMAQFNVQIVPIWWGISFSTVVSEIDAGHPVILLIVVSSTMGHVVVLAGYKQSGTQVFVYDPWPPNVGSTYWTAFSNLKQQWPIAAFETGAAFDFSVSNSGGISIARGISGTNKITVSLASGARPQSVSLSIQGLPYGTSYSFSTTSANPTFTSTLTIKASTSATKGSFTITVTASGGGKSHSTTFTLTIK